MTHLPDSRAFWRGIPRRSRRRRQRPLNAAELATIADLNSELLKCEQRVRVEAETLRQAFEARLAAGDATLTDFELDVRVTFHLRQGDLRFDADDDNILMALATSLRRENEHRRETPVLVSNEVQQALSDAQVSELLFSLLEYAQFAPADLCRIGSVWTDVVATAQRCTPLTFDCGLLARVAGQARVKAQKAAPPEFAFGEIVRVQAHGYAEFGIVEDYSVDEPEQPYLIGLLSDTYPLDHAHTAAADLRRPDAPLDDELVRKLRRRWLYGGRNLPAERCEVCGAVVGWCDANDGMHQLFRKYKVVAKDFPWLPEALVGELDVALAEARRGKGDGELGAGWGAGGAGLGFDWRGFGNAWILCGSGSQTRLGIEPAGTCRQEREQ